MKTGVDAHGPRGTLERYIAQQEARPAATAQVPNDTTRAFRALTLKYQKHFDRAQFPDSFWSDLLAAAPAAPKFDAEIARLRERAERLETALRYAIDNPSFDSATFDSIARAALTDDKAVQLNLQERS